MLCLFVCLVRVRVLLIDEVVSNRSKQRGGLADQTYKTVLGWPRSTCCRLGYGPSPPGIPPDARAAAI